MSKENSHSSMESKMTKQIDKIMEQAQVFASAWSIVGSRFDGGTAMDDAEVAKNELRQMVTEALAKPDFWEGYVPEPKKIKATTDDYCQGDERYYANE